jgi:hypothetical protein
MIHVNLVNILILYTLFRHFDISFRVPCRGFVDNDFLKFVMFYVSYE